MKKKMVILNVALLISVIVALVYAATPLWMHTINVTVTPLTIYEVVDPNLTQIPASSAFSKTGPISTSITERVNVTMTSGSSYYFYYLLNNTGTTITGFSNVTSSISGGLTASWEISSVETTLPPTWTWTWTSWTTPISYTHGWLATMLNLTVSSSGSYTFSFSD
jgi:hypothetical protein